MTLSYKLAAIDIDETLVGHDAVISAENAESVTELRRRGVRVVLASGRSHANMLPFHRSLGLGDGPVISSQGALVADAERVTSVWRSAPLAEALVADVTRDGFARGFGVAHYRVTGVHLQARTRWTDYDEARGVDPQRLVPDLLALDAADPVLKIMWLDDPARISAAVPETVSRYHGQVVVTPTDPPYLEFAAPEATKAIALAMVAERFGISRDAVLAFGDGNNDAPMLAWAGLGVAMDHAKPAAIAAARMVAPAGNPETALSRAIQAVLALGSE